MIHLCFHQLFILFLLGNTFLEQNQDDLTFRSTFDVQAASLLMWTVYLQIGAQPISFATAAAVQVRLKSAFSYLLIFLDTRLFTIVKSLSNY